MTLAKGACVPQAAPTTHRETMKPILIWQSADAPPIENWLPALIPDGATCIAPWGPNQSGAPLLELGTRLGKRKELVTALQSFVRQAEQNQQVLRIPIEIGTEFFHACLLEVTAQLGGHQVMACWNTASARLTAWDAKNRQPGNLAIAGEQINQMLRRDGKQILRYARVLQSLILIGASHECLHWEKTPANTAETPASQSNGDRTLALEKEWLTNSDQRRGFLKPVIQSFAAPAGVVRFTQLDELPRLLHEGDLCGISGAVVAGIDLAAQEACRLILRQGEHRQRLSWGQPSATLKTKFPGIPSAGNSRFKQTTTPALVKSPARVIVRMPPDDRMHRALELKFEPLDRAQIVGIYLARWGIGYQPIPKVACTSLKEAFFELIAGRKFDSADTTLGAAHVHRYFDLRKQDISHADWKFMVVRDPVKRFISGFANRVIHHKELSEDYVTRHAQALKLDLANFKFDPTMDEFIENFDAYRKVPTIDHHFAPIADFTAPLDSYDRVYSFEELPTLCDDLTQRIGQKFSIPHTQRGGPKLSASSLSKSSQRRLLELYAEDYKILDRFYEKPAVV